MTNAIPVIIHADSDHLMLIDDVVHIPIDEVGIEATLLIINHEHLLLLANNTSLFIVIDDVKIRCLAERTELEVKHAFDVRIPRLLSLLPEGDQPGNGE